MKKKACFLPMAAVLLLLLMVLGLGIWKGTEEWTNIALDDNIALEDILESDDVLLGGRYSLSYALRGDQPVTLKLEADGNASIVPNRLTISPDKPEGEFSFTLYTEVSGFHFSLEEGSPEVDLDLTLRGKKPTDRIFTGVFLCLLLMASVILNRHGYFRGEKGKRLLILGAAAAAASMPSFSRHLLIGDDALFHVVRLFELVSGMRSGSFPVRIGGYTNHGFGLVTPAYYGSLFLYIPAWMVLAGTTVQYAMNVFLILMNVGTTAAMYVCAKRIFKEEPLAIIASVLYTLAPYRLTDVYVRSAIGEALAMMLLPVVALAFYEVLFGDREQWPLLALSAAAVFRSHSLSTMFFAGTCLILFLIFIRRVIREKRFASIMKAAVSCILLCAFAFGPLLSFGQDGINTENMLYAVWVNALEPGELLMNTMGGLNPIPPVFGIPPKADWRPLEIGLPLVLASLCALLYWCGKPRKDEKDHAAMLLFALGAGFAWMSTTFFPWRTLQNLLGDLIGYIQFPWRILMMADFFLALAGAYGLSRMEGLSGNTLLAGVLGLCMMTATPMISACMRELPVYEHSMLDEERAYVFDYVMEGSTPYDTIKTGVQISGDGEVSEVVKGGTMMTAEVDCRTDCEVSLPLYGYTGYEADIDGTAAEVGKDTQNHLMVKLPAGTAGQLTVRFAGKTSWRVLDLASLFTLTALLVRGIIRKKRNENR